VPATTSERTHKTHTHHVKHRGLALVVEQNGAGVAVSGSLGVGDGLEEFELVHHKVKHTDLQTWQQQARQV